MGRGVGDMIKAILSSFETDSFEICRVFNDCHLVIATGISELRKRSWDASSGNSSKGNRA